MFALVGARWRSYPTQMTTASLSMIGFGEAGRTFALAGQWADQAQVYDRLTDDINMQASMRAEYGAARVRGQLTCAAAVTGCRIVLSQVTADQALASALEVSQSIEANALYCDLNSVAPETKRASAEIIEAAGGRYVDVAVMSPVQPAALAVPLLLSGHRADEAAKILISLGFSNVRVVGPQVGRASSIKMIRSVMIKGMEALIAECILAASQAGVLDEVVNSLDASWPGAHWAARADYNLDRMMVHGSRRSAEMEEVVRTLDDMGVDSDMSRATAVRQAALGAMGLKTPPEGLLAKIASIHNRRTEAA
ncbi:NAD(P)-dependent oxidoreductase [Brevundimonas sp.]|uniref:NAD(P)-dependent oxidoreductase n=1 Tax=Brevundimonas sp. TaxID=1871086 RepID=UPI0026161507|nr:NAD(P)-dependent oxidoreductase [Brevundimonas sp.]